MKQIKKIDKNTIEIDGVIYTKADKEPKIMNYYDVCKGLFLGKRPFYQTPSGSIEEVILIHNTDLVNELVNRSVAPTEDQVLGLKFLNALINVATYLNPKGYVPYKDGMYTGYFHTIYKGSLSYDYHACSYLTLNVYFATLELLNKSTEILGPRKIEKAINLQLILKK